MWDRGPFTEGVGKHILGQGASRPRSTSGLGKDRKHPSSSARGSLGVGVPELKLAVVAPSCGRASKRLRRRQKTRARRALSWAVNCRAFVHWCVGSGSRCSRCGGQMKESDLPRADRAPVQCGTFPSPLCAWCQPQAPSSLYPP